MKSAIVSLLLFSVFTLLSISLCAQKKTAQVSGKVLDESEMPLANVSVIILGKQTGIITNDTGYFQLTVAADNAFALIFSHTGKKTIQKNFLLNENETEHVVIRMENGNEELPEIIVTSEKDRTEAGLIKPNPKTIINLPAVSSSVESLIKVFVGSNNELTSQYSVRGGSFDENLIYVNDFEIFRPYLIRNGQQEGLSFINPEMVQNINFYNGGFQARYGDKMSSVLDIQYKKPKQFGGSAYIGILEQGLHLQGKSKNNRFTYLAGARNRSNKNLLSSQSTQGNYVPSSADLQALFTYKINEKWQAELLGNISKTRFSLMPEFNQLTSSVFSPFFTANFGIDIYFSGQEKDEYSTKMAGLSIINQVNKSLRLKWLASYFANNETENIDITGAYLFGERDFDKSQPTYGSIINPLGAGVYQNFARNKLTIANWNLSHKGELEKNNHSIRWGLSYDKTNIDDKLHEWEFQDSAGYSIPYQPDFLQLNKFLHTAATISVDKYSGYLQDNILLNASSSRNMTITGGLRFNYNSLNKEFLLSPRIGFSWQPNWKRDIVFRAAAGAYHQPPLYRELRRYDGSVNTELKAQKSWQGVLGFDYSFKGIAGRPMRWTTEAYYKHLTDVVPYDIDNVRIRYFGNNNAKAYAAGLEMRLYGELVKDAESWVSIGFMRSKEDIKGDTYKQYTLNEFNEPVDSITLEKGQVRRPTDRTITFGMFFQDYLATNKNFKVYLNLLYGSNLPYNIPGSVKYRNALVIPPYIRIDMGFSALLIDMEKSNRRSHSPFRNFESIWASLELFNVIDRANTISYLLVKDFSNTTFTMPNRLTPRLVNFKIVARW